MVTAHNHIKCDLRPIGLTVDAGQTLASVVGGPTSGLSFPQSADEVSANARLIAAAPDLLAACRMALMDLVQTMNYDEGDPQTLATVSALEAAIAKATNQ